MILVRHLGAYGFTSAVCVTLNILILIAGELLGMHYVLSTIVSYVFCVIVGYALHSRFSFKSTFNSVGLLRYSAAMIVNLPVAVAAIWLLHDLLRVPMVFAAPASAAVLTIVNYILNRWAITGKMSIGS